MNFDELYEKIGTRLERIAIKHNGHGRFIDHDDLHQEMCIHLWNNYKDGMPGNVNESYVIKGCEFHILNYIRKNRDKASIISIEQPLNEDGDTVEDVVADDTVRPICEVMDREIVLDEIRNNGFSEKEKAVFFLLIEGRTTREVGRRLGISHVMVLKHKKKLIKSVQRLTKPN